MGLFSCQSEFIIIPPVKDQMTKSLSLRNMLDLGGVLLQGFVPVGQIVYRGKGSQYE